VVLERPLLAASRRRRQIACAAAAGQSLQRRSVAACSLCRLQLPCRGVWRQQGRLVAGTRGSYHSNVNGSKETSHRYVFSAMVCDERLGCKCWLRSTAYGCMRRIRVVGEVLKYKSRIRMPLGFTSRNMASIGEGHLTTPHGPATLPIDASCPVVCRNIGRLIHFRFYYDRLWRTALGRATMRERLLLGIACPQFSGSGPLSPEHAVSPPRPPLSPVVVIADP
jgi:hypothetical protein